MNKKDMLKDEIFFDDPSEEFVYFEKRMNAIAKYNNQFFYDQAVSSLIKRYTKALASLTDEYESMAYRDVYYECLNRLGINDYCIEQEVENYRDTHGITKENIHVSRQGRK